MNMLIWFSLCEEKGGRCWAVVVLGSEINLGPTIQESKHPLGKHYHCLLARELGYKCWTWFLSAHLVLYSHGDCPQAQVCLKPQGVSSTCAQSAGGCPLGQRVGRDIGLSSPPAAWKASLWAAFGRQNTLPRCFVWREKDVVGRLLVLFLTEMSESGTGPRSIK